LTLDDVDIVEDARRFLMHEILTLDDVDIVEDAFCSRMHEALTLDVVDTVEDARRFLIHKALTLDVADTVEETFLVLAASETTVEIVAIDIAEPRTRLNPTPVTVVDCTVELPPIILFVVVNTLDDADTVAVPRAVILPATDTLAAGEIVIEASLTDPSKPNVCSPYRL
jgi:hypothetical protein